MKQPSKMQPRTGIQKWILVQDEDRLRAGWRLIAHFLLMGFLALLLLFALGLALSAFGQDTLFENPLITQSAVLLAVTLSIIIARHWIDQRPFLDLGLRWNGQAAQDLLIGTLIAGALMGFIFVIELSLGWLSWGGFVWVIVPVPEILTMVLGAVVVFMFVAWTEELLARGYWLQNIAAGSNLTWGVVVSSVFFAILHASNPNVRVIAIVGLLLAGLFLAYGFVRTRTLWLAIGLHFGWNFFESTVFGFPVSGLDAPGLMVHQATGPELITGGAFGPEAGLILLPALAFGAGLVYLYTRDRDLTPKPKSSKN